MTRIPLADGLPHSLHHRRPRSRRQTEEESARRAPPGNGEAGRDGGRLGSRPRSMGAPGAEGAPPGYCAQWECRPSIRPMAGRSYRGLRLLEQEGANHQGVERGGPEALHRIARGTDDGLSPGVERRIHEDGYTGARLERLDEVVVGSVLAPVDRLDTGGAVHVPN